MRVMMIVKASPESEAGELPTEEKFAAMAKYNQELMKAGVLRELAGLKPTSKGARVRFDGGKPIVIDGPFAETKDLVGGFWIIEVQTWNEAIEWARRIPPDQMREVELRPFYEMEDFLQGEALDRARKFREGLAQNK